MKSFAWKQSLAALLAVVALASAPGLLLAPAEASPGFAAPTRLIKLDGTQNTRTFDGYVTRDSKSITAAIIRSDNLSKITAADAGRLARLGVTTIIDLRTSMERAIQPDRSVPGARLHYDDVLGATPPSTLIDLTSAYRAFVTDAHARAEFASALRLITRTVASGHTVVFHCTAGKDRTGWTAAMLLTVAGVDRATVERDYLDSNVYRHTNPNDPLNGVNLGLLRTSFSTANQVYGSFDNYLRSGLRLSAAEVTALRNVVRTPLRLY